VGRTPPSSRLLLVSHLLQCSVGLSCNRSHLLWAPSSARPLRSRATGDRMRPLTGLASRLARVGVLGARPAIGRHLSSSARAPCSNLDPHRRAASHSRRAARASRLSRLVWRAHTQVDAPLRLEPQLEGIITRFQSSIKASRGGLHEDKSKSLVNDFGQLQRVRVQNVLLVCSDYDSYTFEEEGLLNELVFQWCARTRPPAPPRSPARQRLAPPPLPARASPRVAADARARRAGTRTIRSRSRRSSTASRRPSSPSCASRSGRTTWSSRSRASPSSPTSSAKSSTTSRRRRSRCSR
jgi:hypothetical protein